MVHPRAVREFAYDWRLPVLHNARLLARAAREHLATWRATQDHERLRALQADPSPAQLVLVAHSMGGLLARALPLVEGTEDEASEVPTVTEDIRATVALGTPFRGAAKAAIILANGRGLLPPRRQMMRLARQLPGIYDLLPSYRCVYEGDDVRPLTAEDVARFGGDPVEAQRAFDDRTRLDTQSLIGHRLVLGVEQPTLACLRLDDETVEGLGHTFRPSRDGKIVHDERGVPAHFPSLGDGTVPVDSAIIRDVPMDPRAQQHGSLANVDEAISSVRFVITGEPQGPTLAPRGQVGIDAPDVVSVGAEWPVAVTGVESPDDATCQVIDAETGKHVARPQLEKRDGQWQFIVNVPDQHLYEIVVDGGSGSPLKRMTLATSQDEPADDLGDDD
ncbi:hypothetical protein Q5425_43170 [Amycolatopsis sp. A133]|uniref:lipase/acyltransferase domain-containing protein n=1 Tax=Amycolatopsis sp. A133 TaxID=3064472 RepID=UPI0027FC3741|nr:hypothetical protein [Amycolatopsis sp. A133]MDQ7810568.1 hypothetical protein [Amycolatopsis sp. A133]